VAAHLALPTKALQAGLLAAALLVGLLAGLDPPLAVLATLALGFTVLAMVDLTVGLALFAVLSFLDTVLPAEGGGTISAAKAIGLLLVLSWLALITTGELERRQRIFSHPAFLGLLAAFIGWTAMSGAWAEETGPVVEAVIRYLPNAMLFLIVFSAVRTRDEVFVLLGAFVVGALISAGYGLAVPTDPEAADRLSGGVGNANETAAALVAGTVLAAALAAALRDQPVLRLLALLSVPFCAYGILLTLSRGGLVALAASLVAAVVVAGRWRAAAVAIALATATAAVLYFAAFAPDAARERVTTIEGGTGRSDVWTVGWRMVEDEPLRGVGAGNFPNSSIHYLLEPGAILRDDFIVDTPKVAHNMYLEVLAELGIPGLAMFVLILGFSLGCTLRAMGAFRDGGDAQLEIVARALFVALVGLLAADFFGSRQFSKQLWLLLALGPALLAIARAQASRAPSQPPALSG
jgi:O-antigen ligase